MSNKPLSPVVAPADASTEGTNSGMGAGTCAPGIGFATDQLNPKAQDFTQADTALTSQSIGFGGDSTVTGQKTADIATLKVVDYDGADFNDAAIFVKADTVAVTDAECDSVSGAINLGAGATAADDWITGAIPAA